MYVVMQKICNLDFPIELLQQTRLVSAQQVYNELEDIVSSAIAHDHFMQI